jgi:hypothetical protein
MENTTIHIFHKICTCDCLWQDTISTVYRQYSMDRYMQGSTKRLICSLVSSENIFEFIHY